MAAKSKIIRLKGHETFILREGWMTKSLEAVSREHDVFSKNYGADALGVGTNMAKAIRYWMREGEFVEERLRQGHFLSQLGEIIRKRDPYIEDTFPLWIFHLNIISKLHTVTSWYLLFNEVEAEEFTKEELFFLLQQRLETYVEADDIAERSLRDDCSALINMYVREHLDDYDPEDKKISPFSALGLMKRDGKKYKKVQPERNDLDEKVVFYCIQKYFLNHTGSVSIDDLLKKPNLPGRSLNMKRVMLNDYLDALAEQGYITVNRTAGLDMVYQKSEMSLEDIVASYYEE